MRRSWSVEYAMQAGSGQTKVEVFYQIYPSNPG